MVGNARSSATPGDAAKSARELNTTTRSRSHAEDPRPWQTCDSGVVCTTNSRRNVRLARALSSPSARSAGAGLRRQAWRRQAELGYAGTTEVLVPPHISPPQQGRIPCSNACLIRDLALVERAEIVFGRGLHAVTGETGAGKSLIVDSLGLLVGARADADIVREGAKACVGRGRVPARATQSAKRVGALLEEWGIDFDGETLIVRREVSAEGRSRALRQRVERHARQPEAPGRAAARPARPARAPEPAARGRGARDARPARGARRRARRRTPTRWPRSARPKANSRDCANRSRRSPSAATTSPSAAAELDEAQLVEGEEESLSHGRGAPRARGPPARAGDARRSSGSPRASPPRARRSARRATRSSRRRRWIASLEEVLAHRAGGGHRRARTPRARWRATWTTSRPTRQRSRRSRHGATCTRGSCASTAGRCPSCCAGARSCAPSWARARTPTARSSAPRPASPRPSAPASRAAGRSSKKRTAAASEWSAALTRELTPLGFPHASDRVRGAARCSTAGRARTGWTRCCCSSRANPGEPRPAAAEDRLGRRAVPGHAGAQVRAANP